MHLRKEWKFLIRETGSIRLRWCQPQQPFLSCLRTANNAATLSLLKGRTSWWHCAWSKAWSKHSQVNLSLFISKKNWYFSSIIKRTKLSKMKVHLKGNHGYDYRLKQMHALFVAIGPAIRENNTVATFQNIELYNLFSGHF